MNDVVQIDLTDLLTQILDDTVPEMKRFAAIRHPEEGPSRRLTPQQFSFWR